MVIGLKRKNQLLDPKKSWEYWIKYRTLAAARNKYLEDGLVNRFTGSPPTESAIQKSAYNWMILNQEEARKEMDYAWASYGEILTEEKWRSKLEEAIHLLFYQRPKDLERLLKENGFE